MITIPPPTQLSAEQAIVIREVFQSAGYTADALGASSGLLVPPPREIVPPATLTAFSAGTDSFSVLAHLFFLGLPTDAAIVRQATSNEFVAIGLECGLLAEQAGNLIPQALVIPVQDRLLASDLQLLASQDEAHYVPTLCDAALHLNLVRIQRPVDRVLDLCCGFGLHGLLASSNANQVIATDVNPRAEAFVRFNASLNGRENISAVTGDLLGAVGSEPFDQILCNPPFILSPESVTTYRFSPFELDGFVRELFSQVPRSLAEGGVLQAICEWVEIEGIDWQERLSSWFENSGCDVWILPANRQLPASYAATTLRQTITDPSELARESARWCEYFNAQKVEAIQGGFVFLRKRTGKNWIDFTQLTKPIRQPIGDAIERGFENRDLVFGANDQTILQATPTLAAGLRMTEESRRKGLRWETESITLHLEDGLPVSIGMDQYVKNLIDRFDGQRSVADCLIGFSNDVGLPLETGFTQGLQITKAMLRSDVLRVSRSESATQAMPVSSQQTSAALAPR